MVAGGIGQTPFLALAREYLGSRHYGDPPGACVPRAGARDALLRRANTRLSGRRRRFRAAGRRRADQHRRRHGRASRPGDRLVAAAAGRIIPRRRVVCCGPEPMMEAVAGTLCDQRVPLPGVAGNADGLRHRHLLQLRDQSPRHRAATGTIAAPASKARSSTRPRSCGESNRLHERISACSVRWPTSSFAWRP